MFCLTDGTARIHRDLFWKWQVNLCGLFMIPLFLPPLDKYSRWSAWQQALWERDSTCGGVPERIRALKIFGHIWVQTTTACMAGKCYIHCAMPLGHQMATFFPRTRINQRMTFDRKTLLGAKTKPILIKKNNSNLLSLSSLEKSTRKKKKQSVEKDWKQRMVAQVVNILALFVGVVSLYPAFAKAYLIYVA